MRTGLLPNWAVYKGHQCAAYPAKSQDDPYQCCEILIRILNFCYLPLLIVLMSTISALERKGIKILV